MRRVWFKKEMKRAILDGHKFSTTRNHPIPLGQIQAVSGSRFKAETFAILDIYQCIKAKMKDVIYWNYAEEGFSSPEEMIAYCRKNKLLEKGSPVWFHRFKLIERVFGRVEGSDKVSGVEEK